MPESFNQEALPSPADQQTSKLRAEINEVYRANERLANEYDASENRIRELEERLANLKAEHDASRRQIDEDHRRESEQLTQKVRELDSDNSELKASLVERIADIDTLTKERDQARAECHSSNRSHEAMASKLDQIESEYSACQQQFHQFKQIHQQIADDAQHNATDLAMRTEEVRELASTCETLRDELGVLQRAADATRRELEANRQEIDQLKQTNEQLNEAQDRQAGEAERRTQELMSTNESLRKELADSKRKLELLRQQRAAGSTQVKATKKSGTAKPSKRKRRRDLTTIEGIGPKIKDLLAEAGIETFEQLANSDVSALAKVLSDAGPRFKPHDPATWPEQAQLAAKERWEELDQLQDELKGGRRT